jgi:hypothetical protein
LKDLLNLKSKITDKVKSFKVRPIIYYWALNIGYVMKKYQFVSLIAALFFITACDSPRDRRLYSTSSSSLTSNTTTTTTTSTSTTTTTTVTTPTDVSSSCTWSTDGSTGFLNSSTHAGNFTMCKSTSNDSSIYFQIQTPPTNTSGTSVQLCFVPMTTSGSNSIYIGNPMCGYFTSSTAIKKITFTKYTAYANATMTGVIFFKDTSYYYSAFSAYTNTLTAFQACMNALYYGNTTYCDSFKSTGQYVYKTF